METQASAARKPLSGRRWIAAVVLGVVLAVAAFLVVRALNDDDTTGKLHGPAGSKFTLDYPEGWSPLSQEDVAALPGSPVAVLRRDDRRGIVIVNRQRRVTRNLDALSRQLDRSLSRGVRDFRKVSSQSVNVKAGRGFLYSYIRKRNGTVHTLLAVQTPSGGYTLNAVVPADARDVARQVGTMLRTFDA